ncbi:hypothetical protein KFU94_59945 [Chloroflexi bacterium TSY]|nr:hypothetical protein [Chloroflexi bacterium TSY]
MNHPQQPDGIRRAYRSDQLLGWIEQTRSHYPFQDDLDLLLSYYDSIVNGDGRLADKNAVEIPRRISDIYDSTIVVFLDEFQNAHLPLDNFRIVDYMQEAVESNTCPHFVTGSAIRILTKEILGRGALYGRFRNRPIQALSGYWGTELVKRAGQHYGTTISELMAPIVAERCGGNPFYILALVQQAAELNRPLLDEETINGVLAVDISSGYIWAELYEQVNSWVRRINEQGITKWILYLSALEEENRISLERVQQELKAKEGQDVPMETIRNVLIRLSRGDLLEYQEFGNWFGKVDDPILLEFIKVWGQVELEGYSQARVRSELDNRYRKLAKRVHNYKGYLAEVFMAQVLLSNQNRRKQPLPGHFFNSQEGIELPAILHYLNRRVHLSSGQDNEVDVMAVYSGVTWICQSKWTTNRKTGASVLRMLLEQAAIVQEERDPQSTRMWLFAHEGLTKEAAELAEQEGILWSNREQLDGLLTYLGLRPLPELDDETYSR